MTAPGSKKCAPIGGHDYHFHVRLFCPRGESACEGQPEVAEGEGCDAKALAWWFSDGVPASEAEPHAAETKTGL